MRLTVFHNITIEERYRKSLARLTEGENLLRRKALTCTTPSITAEFSGFP